MRLVNPPATLALRLLGEVTLRRGDQPLAGLPSRKAEALLIYLACTRRPIAREVLADLLWDDRPYQTALSNLRTLLSGLRRVVGPVVVVERDTVRFDTTQPYVLDVETFERGLAASEPSTELQTACDLYQGDFLAGFHLRQSRGFEEWAVVERERLRRLAVNGLDRLVRQAIDVGQYAAGLEAADRLTQFEPLSEAAHQQRMHLLARLGRRAEALAAYATCRRLLAEELEVAPSDQTMALYAHIRSAEALGTHNLPPPTTGVFVGRAAEVEALSADLAHPATRMITVLGPGGIGKTRLAIETARQIAGERPGMFLHGLRWAPLAGLASAQLLAAALVHALGLASQGPPKTQLLDYLREREQLLILDNFEHLLGNDPSGPALLAELLATAPLVKVLVTSRERLNLQEERLFDVGGLSVPALDRSPPNPAGYGAVELFLAGAQRVRRDFAPNATELTAIGQACRLLGGAPLGIQLAAAASRQRSCAEIAAALEHSLDSLTSTLHNVPDRHRSLRAAFDHSWVLLPAAGQAQFARLAIFPETFDAPAAQAVGAVDVAGLGDLVDRSLLQLQTDGRYFIHPTLRQYAAEKLAAWPAPPPMAAQHAAYYLALVAQQAPGESPAQRAALAAELLNVQTAWQWAAQHADLAALGRTTPVLHSFYSVQSWFDEGIAAFQSASQQVADQAGNSPAAAQVLSELLMRLARMQINVGQLAAAHTALERAQALLPQVADPDQQATVLGYLAITRYYAGDFSEAAALAEASRQLAEQTGKQEALVFALNFLGSCAKAQGDYAQAKTYFEAAVAGYRALEDGVGAGMVLNNLGNLAQAADDFATAEQHYRACSALFKEHNYLHGAATALANTGRLATRQGRFAEAQQLLTESLTLKQQINDQRGVAVALVSLADVALSTGAHAEAGMQLGRALRLADQMADVKTVLDGLVNAAELAEAQGQTALAARLTAFTLAHKASARETHDRAQALATKLGGLPAAATVAAHRWQRENTLAEVIAEVLAALAPPP